MNSSNLVKEILYVVMYDVFLTLATRGTGVCRERDQRVGDFNILSAEVVSQALSGCV